MKRPRASRPSCATRSGTPIRLIRATGIATLIVDKTVSAVTAIADRVVILVKGEIVFDGTPAELKANPELMHRHLGV